MCGKCCYTLLKGSICSVNLFVMIAGILMTAGGISLLVTEHLHLETAWYNFSLVSYFLLASGLVTLTVSFLACCGSLISSKCLLATFALCIICLVFGEITLGVLVYFQVNFLISTSIVQVQPTSSLTRSQQCSVYSISSLPHLSLAILNLSLLF